MRYGKEKISSDRKRISGRDSRPGLGKGASGECRFVGVLGRSREKTEALARRLGCRACFALGELMEEGPDYVVEAASVEAVKSCGEAVLSGGADLLVLSIGAFADASFYEKMERCAAANKRRIHILSGAVGALMCCAP